MNWLRPRERRALAFVGLMGLAACAAGPVGSSDTAAAPRSGAVAGATAEQGPDVPRVYVANQADATVTILDASTGDVLETVDLTELGFPANSKPHYVIAEPDGSFWYLSLIGANRVLRLDRSNRVVGDAEFEVPGLLALDPDSDRLFVGRSMSAVNPPRRVGVIDRDDMSVEEFDVLYPRPHALAAHPEAPVAYSASLATNQMAVVNAETGDVDVMPLGGEPEGQGQAGVHTLVQWAVSPDGQRLVGTGEISNLLLVYDVSDPAAPEMIRQVPVEARPWHPVFSEDGRWLWFANKGADAVTVVDTESWTVADVIQGEGLAEPHGLALSPDGERVFVSSNNLRGTYPGGTGTVVVIDAETREIERVHRVGRNAAGVGTRAR